MSSKRGSRATQRTLSGNKQTNKHGKVLSRTRWKWKLNSQLPSQILWDVFFFLQGKYMHLRADINMLERIHINSMMTQLKTLEKREQGKNKSTSEEIIIFRTKINWLEKQYKKKSSNLRSRSLRL